MKMINVFNATVALDHEETKRDPQRISKMKPFINKYNWKGINHPSKIDDWKTLGKNNPTIALNCISKKKKYFQLVFQNITQHVRNK